MKQTVDFQTFRDTFRAYDRMDNFSREGMEVLFDYLEQYEQDTGEELELDVIALCCDFAEDTWDQITTNYSFDIDSLEGLDEDEKIDVVRKYLEDNGALIGETASGFVYRAF